MKTSAELLQKLNLMTPQPVQTPSRQGHYFCLPKAQREALGTPCSVVDGSILAAEFDVSSRGA